MKCPLHIDRFEIGTNTIAHRQKRAIGRQKTIIDVWLDRITGDVERSSIQYWCDTMFQAIRTHAPAMPSGKQFSVLYYFGGPRWDTGFAWCANQYWISENVLNLAASLLLALRKNEGWVSLLLDAHDVKPCFLFDNFIIVDSEDTTRRTNGRVCVYANTLRFKSLRYDARQHSFRESGDTRETKCDFRYSSETTTGMPGGESNVFEGNNQKRSIKRSQQINMSRSRRTHPSKTDGDDFSRKPMTGISFIFFWQKIALPQNQVNAI